MARMVFKPKYSLLLLILLGSALSACKGPENQVNVTVAVDFGPAGKPGVEKAVKVPAKSTVFEALREAFPVVTSAR
jgi:hypothetical protein